MHSTDHQLATVQTRDGPNYNYRRYPALISQPSQSSSPCDSRTHTSACHETQTAHYIHTGRRGRMLVHGDRHLPCIQRPHTRCVSPHTRSLTHTLCLIHTHHTTHTRGGTHPRCLIHTGGFAHTCRLPHERGFFPLQCPFHTRRAGKHAHRHTRYHTTRTRGFTHTRGLTHNRGLIHTRGRTHTRGSSHTTPFTRAMRVSQHAFKHTRVHTHRDIHSGDSRYL